MRKLFILMATLLSTVVVMAGGNASTNLAPVAGIEKSLCDTDTVYVDKIANLMWQDARYTDGEDGAYKRERSVGKVGSYAHAMNYCARLNYDGFSDWRMPTSNELMAVHRQQGKAFVNHRGTPFWSSTATVENKYEVVFPADAYPYMRKPNSSNYIRCVRCLNRER
ncbi:DUF1566 domain-containing protein [Sulfurovum sp.]|uniref:Lcl C-terminal domain-containing protein n=1 Tax=Sulfurovum sp. TaxID=1969726 RepID=UPI002867FD06|nr:DUF1566 domain-containing protein [Sulfurovum sp.]